MKMSGITPAGSSYDVAVSEDGVKWTFFRITENATPEQIRQILPELSPEFKLPRPQMERKTFEEFMATYDLKYLN